MSSSSLLYCSRSRSGHTVDAKPPRGAHNMEFQQPFLPWSVNANSRDHCNHSTQRRRKNPRQSDTLQAYLACTPVALHNQHTDHSRHCRCHFSHRWRRILGFHWLVGLGFGAMWVAFACPALIALLPAVAWVKRRSNSNAE